MSIEPHDLELFKAEIQAELSRLEAKASAKDVAGKAIGKDGLKYITVIVVIGVASSLLLESEKIAAVMGLLGASLTALISMLANIAGATEKERELALAERGFIAQARVEEIKLEQIQTQTAGEERQALYAHDMKIGEGASQWVINLRASVRPVVTYIFVLELVVLNITGLWYAWSQGAPFAIAMENVFSDDEMLILSSIIAFWFGTQAFSGKK